MDGPFGSHDPAGNLEALRASLKASNPLLYRHLALYLQVLRSVLRERVEQACFHLTTRVYPARYLRLSSRQRLLIHQLLQERVHHCCSLLTVEQLVVLARRMDRDRRRRQERRQQQLLRQLLLQQGEDGDADRADSAADGTAATDRSAPLPPGSVRLQLTPPLDAAFLGWPRSPELSADHPANSLLDDLDSASGLPNTQGQDEAAGEDSQPENSRSASGNPLNRSGFPHRSETSEPGGADHEGRASEPDLQDDAEAAALMAALMEGLLAGGDAFASGDDDEDETGLDDEDDIQDDDSLENDKGSRSERGVQVPGSESGPPRHPLAAFLAGPIAAGLQPPAPASGLASGPAFSPNPSQPGDPLPEASEPAETTDTSAEAASPWDQPGLPQDPVLLLRWLEGVEQALIRRLRNLSHGLNVELVRLGLSRGLLPVNLLEAVLQGQIEPQASPANLLRLQLPFGLTPGAPPLQAVAILLRPIDLEMEEPRLRTCRRRIHQHRQQVRKMAQTYRRLQRRLQAHEAERLWLQDIRASRNAGH